MVAAPLTKNAVTGVLNISNHITCFKRRNGMRPDHRLFGYKFALRSDHFGIVVSVKDSAVFPTGIFLFKWLRLW